MTPGRARRASRHRPGVDPPHRGLLGNRGRGPVASAAPEPAGPGTESDRPCRVGIAWQLGAGARTRPDRPGPELLGNREWGPGASAASAEPKPAEPLHGPGSAVQVRNCLATAGRSDASADAESAGSGTESDRQCRVGIAWQPRRGSRERPRPEGTPRNQKCLATARKAGPGGNFVPARPSPCTARDQALGALTPSDPTAGSQPERPTRPSQRYGPSCPER